MRTWEAARKEPQEVLALYERDLASDQVRREPDVGDVDLARVPSAGVKHQSGLQRAEHLEPHLALATDSRCRGWLGAGRRALRCYRHSQVRRLMSPDRSHRRAYSQKQDKTPELEFN